MFTTAYWPSIILLLSFSDQCSWIVSCFWSSELPDLHGSQVPLLGFLELEGWMSIQRANWSTANLWKRTCSNPPCKHLLCQDCPFPHDFEQRRRTAGCERWVADVLWKVISAATLNVLGHTGYINKNSYGWNCIHLNIYLRDSEREKRHSQDTALNAVTLKHFTIY